MNLLRNPPRLADEGPSGYRFRLAAVNMISVRQLAELEHAGLLEADGGKFDEAGQEGDLDGLSIWVHRRSRFCPDCVAVTATWRLSWEVLFADACTKCGLWLVDFCSRCNVQLDWRRDELHRCVCGQHLAAEIGRPAPPSVLRLSRALTSIAMGEAPSDLDLLSGLRLEQCIRLVRLLGAYGTGDGRSTPQKIPNLDQLAVSWPISSYAAEVLCHWPSGMTTLLERLKKMGHNENTGRLGKAFGGFYTALYKSFSAPEFAFLRAAFEGYVVENWTGAVAKRNRRFEPAILNDLAWIPANHACRDLRISRRRLSQLIDEGRVQGERRVSSSGREFLVVRKADVLNVPALASGLTLVDAATRLGLKRQRLSALLPLICPSAERTGAPGCPWSIPPAWVARWERLLAAQRQQAGDLQGCVRLDHLLRYWPWTDDQVGHLLVDIAEGRFSLRGSLAGMTGVGALLLNIDDARQWFINRREVPEGEMTVPEAAIKLEVKQEVVYALVRAGLLVAAARRAGRRAEWRLAQSALERFQEQYVFGRDVAAALNRSPRAIAAFLASEGIAPVAGPGVDGCRQLVFFRGEVDDCLRRTQVGSLARDAAGHVAR